MKFMNVNWMMAALFALALAVAGCGQKNQVDTANLEKSFADSEPDQQTELNNALKAIQSEDYAGASASLQKLAARAELTDAQKQAIQDVLAQIQKAMGEALEEAAQEADETVEGLKKALPGQ